MQGTVYCLAEVSALTWTQQLSNHSYKSLLLPFSFSFFLKIIWAICYLTRARRCVRCRDKYASLGKEKRRQQPQVSPSHWEKTSIQKQSDGKHNRILSWGKSAQSSTDFIVPVYISWGHCQHSNSMKFCSKLAPFNSGLREAKFDMFLDGWRLLFYIANLLYFIRNDVTQGEKLEEFKNTTIFRHPDAWILNAGQQCIWRFSLSGYCHAYPAFSSSVQRKKSLHASHCR